MSDYREMHDVKGTYPHCPNCAPWPCALGCTPNQETVPSSDFDFNSCYGSQEFMIECILDSIQSRLKEKRTFKSDREYYVSLLTSLTRFLDTFNQLYPLMIQENKLTDKTMETVNMIRDEINSAIRFIS